MTRPGAAIVAAALLLGACRGGDGAERLVLDGSPRHPDDQGVATAVSRQRITLDGERTYRLSPSLQSFSTATLETTSVLSREGQYVQVGLDGRTVVWVAGVAAVIPDPPRVYYVGRLKAVDGVQVTFVDGTVLRVLPRVDLPGTGTLVQVEIDPRRHAISKVTRA